MHLWDMYFSKCIKDDILNYSYDNYLHKQKWYLEITN